METVYPFPFDAVLTKQVDQGLQIYGNLARFWVLIFPYFAIKRPEDLQTVLSSKKHTEKIFFYKLLHNFLGNGLITSSGIISRLRRKQFDIEIDA